MLRCFYELYGAIIVFERHLIKKTQDLQVRLK